MEEQKVTEELNNAEEHVESQAGSITSEETPQAEEQKTESPKRYCPESNIVWAIVCTIMCCLPLGIVAIIKAMSVEKLWNQGRYDEAQSAANAAKRWSIAGAIFAVILVALSIILEVLIFGMAIFYELSFLSNLFDLW